VGIGHLQEVKVATFRQRPWPHAGATKPSPANRFGELVVAQADFTQYTDQTLGFPTVAWG
jgi:hypothetical protein